MIHPRQRHQFAPSTRPRAPRTIVLYKNKLDRDNLLFNLLMVGFWFVIGFLLSGGSALVGLICTALISSVFEWREKDREITIYPDEDKKPRMDEAKRDEIRAKFISALEEIKEETEAESYPQDIDVPNSYNHK